MILISHRGNINGKNISEENSILYVSNALNQGYDVEIDIRVIDKTIWLGHDQAQYMVELDFLYKFVNRLWIHCKTLKTLEFFSSYGDFNYFFHDSDLATITSKGYIWVYPGNQPVKNSIAVLPEVNNDNINDASGLCSDFIGSYALG